VYLEWFVVFKSDRMSLNNGWCYSIDLGLTFVFTTDCHKGNI